MALTSVESKPEYVSEQIGRQLSELSDCLDRIDKAAMHVCGSMATPAPQGAKLSSAANGLFDEWNSRLASMIDRARDISGAFSRTTGF